MSEIYQRYEKPVLNIDQQLELLTKQGLIVKNPKRVLHYLRFIGYHRLSGYFRTFQLQNTSEHIFKKGTTFDSIISLYIFDRKLRLLVMDAVERIEVAVRTTISSTMCETYGHHWYLKPMLFKSNFNYQDLMKTIERETGFNNRKKQNKSCSNYFKNYNKPYLPPVWIVAEALSIGAWSNIFSNLRSRKDRKQISDQYYLHYNIMSSWLQSFTYLRNLCAHHSRIWNRKFTVKPKVTNKFKEHFQNNASFYAQAAVLNVFLSVIADGSRWQYRLLDLFDNNPDIQLEKMGFFKNWHNDPFWRIYKSCSKTANQRRQYLIGKQFLAHSKNNSGKEHLLIEHLKGVSDLAGKFAEPFGAGKIAALLGLLHDAGKMQEGFQNYLTGDAPTGPNHAWVGAVLAEKWKLSLGLLGLTISGHHAGLQTPQTIRSYLSNNRKIEIFKTVECALKEVYSSLDSVQEGDWPLYISSDTRTSEERKRRVELFLRFLFSCIVDADFLDTEKHFHPDIGVKRQSKFLSIDRMWQLLEDAQKEFSVKTGKLNQCRKEIYQACLDSADIDPGFFRLTVPTGGGKTRSGLAFALKHANKHHLKRIIVAIPYTSIIEQTVDVYRNIFGHASVLEHHSGISVREDGDEKEDYFKLASENWNAPLIVTTTVQLFESLFANRPSRCRKLHNIASSVIVLDEIQALPVEVLEPTLDVLCELVKNYGVSVVFCTATQPAFEQGSFFGEEFGTIHEIVQKPKDYFKKLARVRYHRIEVSLSWEELAERLQNCGNQALCILNSKKDAQRLIQIMVNSGVNKDSLFHLSANLCGIHRRRVLKDVRDRLEHQQSCFLISTQVVEAGVDIDFPVVFRAEGPLDRIVQAAGRCNREDDLINGGKVYIFKPKEENPPPGLYRTASEYACQFLQSNCDLDDPDIYQEYFKGLYQIAPLDSNNVQTCRENFDYPETALQYRLIRDDTFPIVVPYQEAKEKIFDLINRMEKGFGNRAELWHQLQQFIVNISKYELDNAKDEHLVVEITDGLWQWAGRYDNLFGLMFEPPEPEDMIA